MGALSSRMAWLRGGHAPEQPGAGGEEEEAAAMAAVGGEEEEAAAMAAVGEAAEESEEGGATPSHGGLKRKADPGGLREQAPHRKRTKNISGSVYEALFLRGEGSDVQIRALGAVWNLHRVYLCQSGYFASMFSGAWREATMNTIELQMPDENIDREALHEALGSLYVDTMLIPPSRVVPILATASMLQLDELIQQCGEIMEETVSVQTVCSYYYSAGSYGLPNIRSVCFQWLLDNLMTHRSEELIGEIGLDIMEELIVSSELLGLPLRSSLWNNHKSCLRIVI